MEVRVLSPSTTIPDFHWTKHSIKSEMLLCNTCAFVLFVSHFNYG